MIKLKKIRPELRNGLNYQMVFFMSKIFDVQ